MENNNLHKMGPLPDSIVTEESKSGKSSIDMANMNGGEEDFSYLIDGLREMRSSFGVMRGELIGKLYHGLPAAGTVPL